MEERGYKAKVALDAAHITYNSKATKVAVHEIITGDHILGR